jgi:hypothetical protein
MLPLVACWLLWEWLWSMRFKCHRLTGVSWRDEWGNALVSIVAAVQASSIGSSLFSICIYVFLALLA